MFRRKHGSPWTGSIHCSTESQTQDTFHFIIQFFCSDFSFLYALKIRHSQIIIVVGIAGTVTQPVSPTAEFHVKTIGNGLVGIMHASPIRNYNTVKSPFSFQYIIEQILVMTAMLPFIQIVGTHDSPYLTLLHSSLECRQVNFIQSTVINNDIRGMTIHLMVVQGKMLHTSCNSIQLYTFNVRNYHTGCQVRVLTHVFKITPIERCPINIYTWTQKHSLVTVTCLFSDTFSIK